MVYRESMNLIGSFTVFYLLIDNSCEWLMKIIPSILTNHEALNFKSYIMNFNLYITKLQCTSRAVFETYEMLM